MKLDLSGVLIVCIVWISVFNEVNERVEHPTKVKRPEGVIYLIMMASGILLCSIGPMGMDGILFLS